MRRSDDGGKACASSITTSRGGRLAVGGAVEQRVQPIDVPGPVGVHPRGLVELRAGQVGAETTNPLQPGRDAERLAGTGGRHEQRHGRLDGPVELVGEP